MEDLNEMTNEELRAIVCDGDRLMSTRVDAEFILVERDPSYRDYSILKDLTPSEKFARAIDEFKDEVHDLFFPPANWILTKLSKLFS